MDDMSPPVIHSMNDGRVDVSVHIDTLSLDTDRLDRGSDGLDGLVPAILSALRDDVRVAAYLPNGMTVRGVDEQGAHRE
jgi:hypothetical protein